MYVYIYIRAPVGISGRKLVRRVVGFRRVISSYFLFHNFSLASSFRSILDNN